MNILADIKAHKVRFSFHCFVSVALSLLFGNALLKSTRSYLVWANDFDVSVQAIVLVFVSLLFLAILSYGIKHIASWICLLVLIVGFIFCKQLMINIRLEHCTASCANHSGYWNLLEYPPGKPFPKTNEFYDFLLAIHGNDLEKYGNGMFCPGLRRSGTKTGYVFVGNGLPNDILKKEDVLIAFCSWISHPPPYDHQHCLLTVQVNDKDKITFYRECTDIKGMINRINSALDDAKNGKIPYSKESIEILKYERDNRQSMVPDNNVK